MIIKNFCSMYSFPMTYYLPIFFGGSFRFLILDIWNFDTSTSMF